MLAVIGCADPDVMPEQTWFERSADGQSATIGCVNADVKWSVRCVDSVWLGYHANCTLGLSHQLASSFSQTPITTVSSRWIDTITPPPPSVGHRQHFPWGTVLGLLSLKVIVRPKKGVFEKPIEDFVLVVNEDHKIGSFWRQSKRTT